MRGTRHSEEQIIGILKEAEKGLATAGSMASARGRCTRMVNIFMRRGCSSGVRRRADCQ